MLDVTRWRTLLLLLANHVIQVSLLLGPGLQVFDLIQPTRIMHILRVINIGIWDLIPLYPEMVLIFLVIHFNFISGLPELTLTFFKVMST